MANEKRGKHFATPGGVGASGAGVGGAGGSHFGASDSGAGRADGAASGGAGGAGTADASKGIDELSALDQLGGLDDLDDRELTRLFSSFDEITASSELKSSTLSAIYGNEETEDAAAAGVPSRLSLVDKEGPAVPPDRTRVLNERAVSAAAAVADVSVAVPDGLGANGVDADVAGAAALQDTPSDSDPDALEATAPQRPISGIVQDRVETTTVRRPVRQMEGAADMGSTRTSAPLRRGATSATGKSRRPESVKSRKRSVRLRVAAAFVAVTLILGCGIAYTMPVSNVEVALGESQVTLGVNVFGVTVSAMADGDDAKATLKKIEVHNMRLEDSMERLLSAYEEDHGPNTVHVSMQDRNSGESMQLNGETQNVLKRYEQRWQQDQPAQDQPAQDQPTQNQDAGQSQNQQQNQPQEQTPQTEPSWQPEPSQQPEQSQPQERDQSQQPEEAQPSDQGQGGGESSQPAQPQEPAQLQETQSSDPVQGQ